MVSIKTANLTEDVNQLLLILK